MNNMLGPTAGLPIFLDVADFGMAAAVATVEQVHAVGRWRDTFARGGASEDQYLIGHLGGGDIVFWPYNR